ncbi:hypothetical protein MHU86_7361 [Fragilaria crotonensis]|nr:hypothetical protein MHU86_7361 [Fragilaria crotonensis]
MPIRIARNQHEHEQEVHVTSNLSEFVQHEIHCLSLTFSEAKPMETFALSYIFGHVKIIHRIRLQNGTCETLDKFLQWWHSHHLKLSAPLVHELELCDQVEWDTTETFWLNSIWMEQHHVDQEPRTLKALTIGQAARFDISGLKITHLETLEIPLRSDITTYSLAQALHEGCNLQALDASPINVQHLAAAIPLSVQKLKINWHLHESDGLLPLDALSRMTQAPVMATLQVLELELLGGRSCIGFKPSVFMDLLVQMLQPCRMLQRLRVKSIGKLAKPLALYPVLTLMSTWTTLQEVVLDFPLILDDSCSQVIYQTLQRNNSLTEFDVVGERPSRFSSGRLHYLRLNRLRFSTILLIQDKIPLALWPHVLEKASNWHSVIFELFQQKNDLLLSSAG